MAIHWTIEEKKLDLVYNWKISRNESTFKINYFITISDGKYKGMGEVAPNIRYNETPDVIKNQFETFISSAAAKQVEQKDFLNLLSSLPLCNSLRFALESAFIHWICARNNTSVYKYFGLEAPNNISTTYTLPIMEVGAIKQFIDQYHLTRFKSLKIKVNNETGLDMIKEVSKITTTPLMIDANEAWSDPMDVLKMMDELKKQNILFIEQPLPSALKKEYEYLKIHSPFILMADESITNDVNFDEIRNQFHGVNMKLMKAGGYINGLRILQEAKKHNLKTMIGCMVETTLGISSALNLCAGIDYVDLDGFFLIKDEPFNLVKEKDGLLNLS